VHDSRIHHPALPRSPPQSASYFKRECASGRLPDRAAPDRRAIADVITRLQEVIATGYEPETWGSASLCSGLRAAVGLPRAQRSRPFCSDGLDQLTSWRRGHRDLAPPVHLRVRLKLAGLGAPTGLGFTLRRAESDRKNSCKSRHPKNFDRFLASHKAGDVPSSDLDRQAGKWY
jgi:hypothetical protein